MRILHIIPSLQKGGAERLVVDIVTYLNKCDGIDARIVLFSNQIEYDVDTIADKINIIPSTIQLSIWKKNNFKIEKLQAFIDNFNPSVIHTHLFEAEIVSRSCYFPSAKWISHCHDNMRIFQPLSVLPWFSKEKLVASYEKKYLFKQYIANGGTRFLAISKNTFAYFKKNATKFEVTLLNNAIDYARFDLPKVENNQLKLIAVGRLDENKNYSFLIEVAAILKERGVAFSLEIIGDGTQKSDLKKRIDVLALDQYVFLLGKRNDVAELLNKATIFLHSAKSEAFGLTILEAMAAGLPVITLDGGGNSDLIMLGENGYICETDKTVFADKIISVWNDKELYASISNNARAFAKKFDINLYIARLVDIYKN